MIPQIALVIHIPRASILYTLDISNILVLLYRITPKILNNSPTTTLMNPSALPVNEDAANSIIATPNAVSVIDVRIHARNVRSFAR